MDKHKIVEAIRMALEQTGKMAFQASQEAVPTITGDLKKSGTMQSTSSEFIIKYAKEYAENVERGWAGGKVWTASHMRKGGIAVKGHYKNQPQKDGIHFIENSLRKYFKEKSTGDKTVFQNNILEQLGVYCAPAKIKDEEV